MLASINSLFKFLGWYDCRVKAIKIQREAFCSEEKELTRDEYVRLVKASGEDGNERLCMIMQTICATGIRVSELKYITVEAVRKGQANVNCKGKSRRIMLVKKLQKRLLKYAKERKIRSGVIFVTNKGNAINRTNIWKEMKNLCKAASVNSSKVFPNNLYHFFCACFLFDKNTVQFINILSHIIIEITRIYINLSGAECQYALEKIKLIV